MILGMIFQAHKISLVEGKSKHWNSEKIWGGRSREEITATILLVLIILYVLERFS